MSAEPDTVATEIVGQNNPWIGEFLAEDGDLISVLFQEHIFGLPENALKKSSTYLSLTTNIQNFVMH